MMVKLLVLIFFVLFGKILQGQSFDEKTYSHLLKADKDEFINYSKSVGFIINEDKLSETLMAKKIGCLYVKPLVNKYNIENYDLVLIVSTLDKKNNKIILKTASEDPNNKGIWTDKEFLFKEWDMENPFTSEMWYKVFVYKKKK